jgi:small multidrug resistance pump
MNPWLVLALAIVMEVTGTTALKLSDGLTRLPWVGVVVVGYAGAFAALSFTLRSLPVGLTYAVWSGLGTVGAALIGRALFREALGLPQLAGVALIIAGVVVLQLSTTTHP